jgi:hypothetical protein
MSVMTGFFLVYIKGRKLEWSIENLYIISTECIEIGYIKT